MKVKITKPGVYMRVDGKEQLVPVGSIVSVDDEPLFAINKYEIVEDSKAKSLVVNDDPAVVALREEYKAKSGKDADKRWSSETLTLEIIGLDDNADKK